MPVSKCCEEEALRLELIRRQALERARRLAEAAAERVRVAQAAREVEPPPPPPPCRMEADEGVKPPASARHVAAIALAAQAPPQPLPWAGVA